ncbi:MAG: alanine--glyoxylate aminotransferase family protein [Terrisporobacter othiniensis]|uniref:pyridoxal-phosphate-dependent aminotransferase family protein n=1 Tax=Terrisporobacter petrolearius TaxID=1460447 RepID=UPI0022E0DDD2|nr:alanine--glyoxylate aminotransferase family protein [Terrisporobacter petrolearius]MDU4860591.1 alanine--glyoxylate aminotransferase family protein [Terrisporobacter othiniensis]MDU6994450.1 alanine--glyoxylate aminotransferase family protein [Terrisporobacter othiniensis]
MSKKLFIPGPIDVNEDVLAQMANQVISHRGSEASALQEAITQNLQDLFYTKNNILLSTSSGSGLMEGSIRSCTLKRAAVLSCGSFGDRWYKMGVLNGVPTDLFKVELGKAIEPEMVDKVLSTNKYDTVMVTHNETSSGITNPIKEIGEVVKKYDDIVYCVDAVSSAGGMKIEVDESNIDICLTSVQKALGLPPGMSLCTFSEKAKKRAEKVPNRGYYFDLLAIYEYIQNKNYQYPSTPSLSHMFALNFQLKKILNEGLDNRFKRHEDMANLVRDWAQEHFQIFTDVNYLSNTLTVIKNTQGISVSNLNKKLQERGFLIANGYGDLKEKTFRISHMGDYTVKDVNELLTNINEILGF